LSTLVLPLPLGPCLVEVAVTDARRLHFDPGRVCRPDRAHLPAAQPARPRPRRRRPRSQGLAKVHRADDSGPSQSL